MKTLIQIKKEIWEKKKKFFENYLDYCKEIKEDVKELLGEDIRVFVFGSVVKGDYTPNSDIDILIISKNLSPNWEENTIYKAKIKRKFGINNPFQIHLATPEEYENWFKRFIKKDYIEIQ